MDPLIKQLNRACDPDEPAPAEYYLDCSAARGNSSLTHEFHRRLELADADFLCFLFSGHIGCGKSSELRELERTLDPAVRIREAEQSGDTPQQLQELRRSVAATFASGQHERYFPVLLDVHEYLDDFDVTLTDILLAVITELGDALRTHLRIELKDNYFVKRLQDVQNLALTEVSLDGGEISAGVAKVKISALKTDPGGRDKVRRALEPHTGSLLEEMNLIFERARYEVTNLSVPSGEPKYKDIVLIIDNLEKMRKFEGIPEALDSQRELFLDRSAQLTGMKMHVIYTIPLRLARSVYAPQLADRYSAPFVLPMVKVMDRGTRQPYQVGVDFLRDMIAKRMPGFGLDQIFEPEALKLLIEYSGGHIRSLISFIRNACAYAERMPLSVEAVSQAIGRMGQVFDTSIPADYWIKLAQLERSANHKIPNGDLDYLKMLENLSVLEYINGSKTTGRIAIPTTWYAVNPIVRELEQFAEALASLSALTSASLINPGEGH